jgi:hypothetical protein
MLMVFQPAETGVLLLLALSRAAGLPLLSVYTATLMLPLAVHLTFIFLSVPGDSAMYLVKEKRLAV